MEPTTSEQAVEAARLAAQKIEQSRQEQAADILKRLEVITDWQENHQVEDRNNFKEIRELLLTFPDKESTENNIKTAVQTTVNGKLDKIKRHLDEQDEGFADLKNKILPFDNGRVWLMRLVNAVIYLGVLAGAVTGIILLLQTLKII